MLERGRLIVVLLVLSGRTATAQEMRQVRPEFDLYVNEGSRLRFVFQSRLNAGVNTPYSQGAFSCFVDFALKPLLRRELRHDGDVFRRRYLTFRGGYQYSTTISNGKVTLENRSILEFTGRYPLPLGFVLTDRNRQEFRMVEGQNVSVRYRNRLWAERDLRFKALSFTPYLYDEVYFDTRYHAWSANRLAIGLRVPVGTRLALEPYLLRQINYQGSPSRIGALGFKFSAYF